MHLVQHAASMLGSAAAVPCGSTRRGGPTFVSLSLYYRGVLPPHTPLFLWGTGIKLGLVEDSACKTLPQGVLLAYLFPDPRTPDNSLENRRP